MHDYRKLKEEEVEQQAQKIYFCRFLKINPHDKLMASHVQIMLDNIYKILVSKAVREDMKNVLIVTLKYFIE